MRAAYEQPAVLAAANVPSIKSTTGLGTGGGASLSAPFGGVSGDVLIQVGSNPSAGGTVVLTFPGTPPTLFVAGSEGLSTVTQGTVANDVTLTWAGTPRLNSKALIHYEWFDANNPNP